jgi:hypothetical protein
MAGIAGERRRPAARASLDWRDWELLRGRRLVEEVYGDTAERMAASAGVGAARNGGDGKLWPG